MSSLGTIPDDTAEIALTKERFVFTGRTRDRLEFDFSLGVGGGVPMMHQHRSQAETLRCVRGELTVLLDEGKRVLRAGDEIELAPGTRHNLVNEGSEDVVCKVSYRPALKSEQWFKVLGAHARKTGKAAGLLDLAPFIADVDLFIVGPPVWLQRGIFAALKPVAIALGRRRRMLAIASEAYGRDFEW